LIDGNLFLQKVKNNKSGRVGLLGDIPVLYSGDLTNKSV